MIHHSKFENGVKRGRSYRQQMLEQDTEDFREHELDCSSDSSLEVVVCAPYWSVSIIFNSSVRTTAAAAAVIRLFENAHVRWSRGHAAVRSGPTRSSRTIAHVLVASGKMRASRHPQSTWVV